MQISVSMNPDFIKFFENHTQTNVGKKFNLTITSQKNLFTDSALLLYLRQGSKLRKKSSHKNVANV